MSEVCQACHQAYDTVYSVPDDVWAQISPVQVDGCKSGGLLCPACADARATEKGIGLYWSAGVGRFPDAGSEAVRDIVAERVSQVDAEGWTAEHDDAHDLAELAEAAACYAHHAAFRIANEDGLDANALKEWMTMVPFQWPWSADWWKPKDPRRDLVRAAALLIAEIERLDRAVDAKP